MPQGEQWIYLAAFGALQMGIPYVLFSRGLRYMAGHEASGIGLIEPVLVPIWVYLVWGEPVTWPIVIGGALIFTGLVLRYAGSRPAAQVAAAPPGAEPR
jgi:drug/metabolite transporter (DMT)-like permease